MLKKQFDDVYICSGGAILPRKSTDGSKYHVSYRVIGNPPNVAVPTHFYKVIVATRRQQPKNIIDVDSNGNVIDSGNLEPQLEIATAAYVF